MSREQIFDSSEQVVPKWTATLGMDPTDEITFSLNLSHCDMWRISDPNSSSYQSVRQGVLWLLERLRYSRKQDPFNF